MYLCRQPSNHNVNPVCTENVNSGSITCIHPRPLNTLEFLIQPHDNVLAQIGFSNLFPKATMGQHFGCIN